MFTPFAFIQPITTVTPITPVTPSQYLLIGGSFTLYNTPSVSHIAKIDSTGSLDPSFNMGTGFNTIAYEIKQQPDGKYIVGGNSTQYSGSTSNRITRLNHNGTIDTTFNIGTGFNQTVFAINPQSDNSNIIGGNFTTYSGSAINRIIKITLSGSIDTSFNIGTGFENSVYDMVTQSDGKIVVVGQFTTYSGSTSNRIIRINTDGTIDTTFNVGTGLNGISNAVGLQSDGKIVVVGAFTAYSGSSNNYIVRINTDGTKDTTFNIGTGLNNFSNAVELQSDGKILSIGLFTTYSGSTSNRIIRINTDGTRDTTFNIGTGFNQSLTTIAKASKILQTPDGKIYVSPNFSNPGDVTYSGSFVGNFMRLNSDGTLDNSFITTATSSFNTLIGGFTGINNPGAYSFILSGSSLITVGNYLTYKNVPTNRGLMINSSGLISSSFNIGTGADGIGGFSSTVLTWATQSDGKILAGGQFTQYSGSGTINRLVRINTDGTRDTTFNIGTGFSSTVRDVRVQSDGKIVVVGDFNTYSGSTVNGIVRLNVSGTIDNTFNVGTGFTLSTQGNHCKIQSDGKIVVVGQFTTYSGSTNNRIVRINTDGTIDTTFNIGTGFLSNAEAVILQPDNKILVAGQFSSYSGSSNNALVRINTDGTKDTTFNIGSGLTTLAGYALALQSDGKIIFAHGSQQYSGSVSRYITRINTNGTRDTTFNANANSSISTIGLSPNGLAIDNTDSIYWGNNFTTFSGSFTPNRIVKLNSSGTVDQTFNQVYSNFINNTGKGANSAINAILLL